MLNSWKVIFAGLIVYSFACSSYAKFSDSPFFSLDRYVFDGLNGWAGGIKAVEYADGKIYVGGDFTQVGPPTGNGALLALSDGSILTPFPMMTTGNVKTSVPDGKGGWFVVTSEVGGKPYHIEPDGTVDNDWNPYFNKPVSTLAVYGDKVYVGGHFDLVGKETRNCFAVLNAVDGSLDDWAPNPNGPVSSIQIVGNTIVIGGWFEIIANSARGGLASFDLTNETLDDWNPDLSGPVMGLLVDGNRLYVNVTLSGGGYPSLSGIFSYNMDDRSLHLQNPSPPNQEINGMAIADGNLVIVGNFTSVAGQPRDGIVFLDKLTGTLSGWNCSFNESARINCVAINGDRLLVGGVFETVNGVARNNIASFNIQSETLDSWDYDVPRKLDTRLR
jgi:hypothetical protein